MRFIHWRMNVLIEKYLTGTLSTDEFMALETHFAKCAKCRLKLEEGRKFQQKIKLSKQMLDSSWEKTRKQILQLPPVTEYPIEPEKGLRDFIERWIPVHNRQFQLAGMITGLTIFLIITAVLWTYFTKSSLTPVQLAGRLGEGVEVRIANSISWNPLEPRDIITPGMELKTSEFGKGVVTLGKSGKIWMNQSTEIKIYTNPSTAIELMNGDIYVSVHHLDRPFLVKTPGGIIEVAGTEFMVSVDNQNNTRVSCVQDTVYFRNTQGEVTVYANFQSTALPDTSPTPPDIFDVAKSAYWQKQFEQFHQLSMEERKQLRIQYIKHGDSLYDTKKYQDALERYWIGVFLDAKDYSPYYGIGRSYFEMGEYALATSTYYRAISKKPDLYAIYYQLALCLMELHQYSEMEKLMLAMNKKRSDNPVDWTFMGNAFLFQNKLDTAEKAYKAAIHFGAGPESLPYIHGGLAEIARRNDDHHTALKEIQKALKYSTVPALVYAEAGWIYQAVGYEDQELDCWRQYVKLNPKGGFADYAKNRIQALSPQKPVKT